MNYRQWLILVVVIFFYQQSEATDYRISTLNNSWHFDDRDYNEQHDGLGLEYQFTPGYWVGALMYNNSYNDQSVLLAVNREYEFNGAHIGWLAGAASGYDGYQVGAGITIRYKYIRLIVMPSVAAIGFVF